MEPLGSHFKRCVYKIVFQDNSIYIGLTYNLYNRISRHKGDKTDVAKKMKKMNFNFFMMSDYIDKKKASDLEKKLIKKYAKKYKLLNKVDGGGLGGGVKKWTKYEILKEVKKCYNYHKFYNNRPLYSAVTRNGLLPEIKQKFFNNNIINRDKKWNLSKILNYSKKYNSYCELKNDQYFYNVVKRYRLCHDVKIKIFGMPSEKRLFLTNEEIFLKAQTYQTYKIFKNKNPKIYAVAKKRKILSLIKVIFLKKRLSSQ